MPTQVLPITDLAKAGVIMDLPSVSLPPNVFSDCRNVRFRDGAIRKMEGEQEILFNVGPRDLVFIAYWPEPSLAPDNGYMVIVGRDNTTNLDTIHIFEAASRRSVYVSNSIPVETTSQWQHTLFGGGSVLVMNNGTSVPMYLRGTPSAANPFYELPGWDSYLVDEQVTSFFYDLGFLDPDVGTDVGQFVSLSDGNGVLPAGVTTTSDQRIIVTVIPADTRIEPFTITVSDYDENPPPQNNPDLWDANAGYNGPTGNLPGDTVSYLASDNLLHTYTATRDNTGVIPEGNPTDWRDNGVILPITNAASVGYRPNTGTTSITFAARRVRDDGIVEQPGVLTGDSVTIRIQTVPEIQVRARVIRTYGNLLVAGNLTEMMRSDPDRIVRNLPGVIRTSDVAAPGSVPANWNPFKTGVNTADEFTLSSTGIVQDMAELQGILYIYTNDSIHSVQQTGNTALPFNVRPVATGWGAQTIDAIQEFDGKHIVVGSSDIYVFAGHPGSIQSIADMRVRRFLFQDLDPAYEQNLFTMLYRRRDEIWFNYPSLAMPSDPPGQCTRTLIWNYRNNTWTVREQSSFWNGVVSPIQPDETVDPNQFYPLMTSTQADAADADSVFVADADNNNFTNVAGQGYPSYVERTRLAMAPEFTTENLLSVAMLTEGVAVSGGQAFAPTLEVRVVGTNNPAEEADLTDTTNTRIRKNTFEIESDYKVDIREHGRLLNYRITDEITGSTNRDDSWLIAGLQFDIGTGGTR